MAQSCSGLAPTGMVRLASSLSGVNQGVVFGHGTNMSTHSQTPREQVEHPVIQRHLTRRWVSDKRDDHRSGRHPRTGTLEIDRLIAAVTEEAVAMELDP